MYRRVLSGLIALWTIVLLAASMPARADEGPNFQILEPRAEQSLQTQFSISVAFQSSDKVPIVRFDAYMGTNWLIGGRIVNPIPAGSFKVDADLSAIKVPPGVNTLFVKLIDSQGRTAQREQKVVVPAKVSPPEHYIPTVRILNPKNGATITANSPETHIHVDATDPSGIKWVFVYINDKLYALQDKAPFDFTWNPFKYKWTPGDYKLRARAVDMFENEGNSETVIVHLVSGSNGLTMLEQTPALPLPAEALPGVFAPSITLPSPGSSIPRYYSNVVSPLTEWLASAADQLMPSTFTPMRAYALPLAQAEALAILPAKALPELQTQELRQPGIRGYQSALPLAGLTTMAPHPLLFDSPLLMSAPLLPFSNNGTSAQPNLLATPGPMAAYPAPQKGSPDNAMELASVPGVIPSSATPLPSMGGTVGRPDLVWQTPGALLPQLPATAAVQSRPDLPATQPLLLAMAVPTAEKLTPGSPDLPRTPRLATTTQPVTTLEPALGGTLTRAALSGQPVVVALAAPQYTQNAGASRPAMTSTPILIALVPAEMVKRAPTAGVAASETVFVPVQSAALPTPDTGQAAARVLTTGTTTEHLPTFLPRPDMDTAHVTAFTTTPEKRTPATTVSDTPVPVKQSAAVVPTTGAVYPRKAVSEGAPISQALQVPGATASTRTPATATAPRILIASLPGKLVPEPRNPADSVPAVNTIDTSVTPTSGTTYPRSTVGEGGSRIAPQNAPTTPAPGREQTTSTPRLMVAGLPGKLAPEMTHPEPVLPVHVVATPAQPAIAVGNTMPRPPATPRSATAPTVLMQMQAPYTVRAGDTLVKIAAANATTPDTLIKLNPNLSASRPLPVNAPIVVPKPDVHIYLDDAPLTGAPVPFISHGNAMLPFRKVVEAKKGTVVWLPKTQEVNAWANHTYMALKIGDRNARINDQTYLLPVAAVVVNSRTMVPVRYLMTALKLEVEYNAASGAYYLVSRLAQ